MDETSKSMQPEQGTREAGYLQLLTDALHVCAQYKPKLGMGGSGQTLENFQQSYGSDPFYAWIGLDSPLMYSAHKAAGGMTSIYRQIGIGCQRIFSQILQDELGLSSTQANWSYQVTPPGGTPRTLALDGRIEIAHVADTTAKGRIAQWLERAEERLQLPDELRGHIKGSIFEVRQGYKSMDSKRQNADIANATNSYINFYLPVLLLFSTQIDQALADRYSEAKWLLLKGTTTGDELTSTYTFCRNILGYDLAAFFRENSTAIKQEVNTVLMALLSP